MAEGPAESQQGARPKGYVNIFEAEDRALQRAENRDARSRSAADRREKDLIVLDNEDPAMAGLVSSDVVGTPRQPNDSLLDEEDVPPLAEGAEHRYRNVLRTYLDKVKGAGLTKSIVDGEHLQ